MSTQKYERAEKSRKKPFSPEAFKKILEKNRAKEIVEGAKRLGKHVNPVMVAHVPVDL